MKKTSMNSVKKESGERAHSDEHSSVRDSRQRSSPPEQTGAPRTPRIEGKVRRAERLLAQLAPNDPRTRLLQVAILRLDEALLDGILASLEKPPTR